MEQDGFAQVLPPESKKTGDRGWHIVVPREVHDRWHRAAEALGMNKKSFTTMCIEHYIQLHMPKEDKETRQDRVRAEVAELLRGILDGQG